MHKEATMFKVMVIFSVVVLCVLAVILSEIVERRDMQQEDQKKKLRQQLVNQLEHWLTARAQGSGQPIVLNYATYNYEGAPYWTGTYLLKIQPDEIPAIIARVKQVYPGAVINFTPLTDSQ
jgi:hypothetical protein